MANPVKKQTLRQVQADAARITRNRIFEPDDDGNVFEPHYPNGYMKDTAEVVEDEQTPLEKARAAKAEKAKAAKAEAEDQPNEENK